MESEALELLRQHKSDIITEVMRCMGFQGVSERAKKKIIQAINQTPNPKMKQ